MTSRQGPRGRRRSTYVPNADFFQHHGSLLVAELLKQRRNGQISQGSAATY